MSIKEADAGGQESGRPKNCTTTEGNKTKDWQTAHNTLTVKLRAKERGFLSRSHHQTTSGHESKNKMFYTKDLAFQCLPPLMRIGLELQSIPGAVIMWLPYVTPLQHHRLFEPQHAQAQIDPNNQHCVFDTSHDQHKLLSPVIIVTVKTHLKC